jgi:glutamate dehydrogenase (NAD(P)+)
MAWMMDTYSMNTGTTATGVVTGKPLHLGGSLGRVKATGRGVFVTGREAARRLGLKLDGARVAVQGMGNVGASAAELFVGAGAKVVAMQDHTGTLINPRGFDMATTMPAIRHDAGIANVKGGERIDNKSFWDVDCDILIPAALEGQITPVRAQRIKAKLVLEGANRPTLPEADDVLGDRNVLVVPDVICNAGGVSRVRAHPHRARRARALPVAAFSEKRPRRGSLLERERSGEEALPVGLSRCPRAPTAPGAAATRA